MTTRTYDEEKKCWVLICKGTVGAPFSIAHFKKVRDNMEEDMKKLTSKHFEPYVLESIPGVDRVLLTNINLPFPMSNRTFMNCLYFCDVDGSTYWQASSSKDTDELVQQHKDKIKKNVIGTNHMNFTLVKDTEDGVEWSGVVMSDMGGSFPSVAIKKMSEEQAKESHGRIYFMLTGEPMIKKK